MPRNPDRESGIDDPGDETLEALNAPLDNLFEEEPEDDHQSPPVSRTPTPPPAPLLLPVLPPPAMAAAAPTAPQLATIPVYDGSRGDAYINWINLVKPVRGAYGWDHRAILQVVRIKGGPKVQE